jgi:predicted metal-binding protein
VSRARSLMRLLVRKIFVSSLPDCDCCGYGTVVQSPDHLLTNLIDRLHFATCMLLSQVPFVTSFIGQ